MQGLTVLGDPHSIHLYMELEFNLTIPFIDWIKLFWGLKSPSLFMSL